MLYLRIYGLICLVHRILICFVHLMPRYDHRLAAEQEEAKLSGQMVSNIVQVEGALQGGLVGHAIRYRVHVHPHNSLIEQLQVVGQPSQLPGMVLESFRLVVAVMQAGADKQQVRPVLMGCPPGCMQ